MKAINVKNVDMINFKFTPQYIYKLKNSRQNLGRVNSQIEHLFIFLVVIVKHFTIIKPLFVFL